MGLTAAAVHPPVRTKLRTMLTVITTLGAMIAAQTAVVPPATAAQRDVTSLGRKLARKVDLPAVHRHLRELQRISDANGGRRASGTPGFDATATYVHDTLAASGLTVSYQEFPFWFTEELAPAQVERVSPDPVELGPDDVVTMQYSISGEATGLVQPIDVVVPPTPKPTSSSGCTPEDFASFVPGRVALVQRGGCRFEVKVQNAEQAGASAIMIFNEGQPGRTATFLGSLAVPSAVPVVIMSYDAGAWICDHPPVTVRVKTSTIVEERMSRNVFAETATGDPETVVMAGAHLDSVTFGAGINDNGSGVAGLLETAVQLGRERVANKVRFAFWGGEEFYLHGSTYYTSHLAEAELDTIALYLNFDMIASPNYVRSVLDGDGSSSDGAAVGPPGSGEIEQLFQDYYEDSGKPVTERVLDGGSDFQPFLALDIPVGGLFSGSTALKTEAEATMFGGTAGLPLDPCNHLACDNLNNINMTALAQNSDAIAFAIGRYALEVADVVEAVEEIPPELQ